MTEFENNAEELDLALKNIGSLPENIWYRVAAGQQQQRYDEQDEKNILQRIQRWTHSLKMSLSSQKWELPQRKITR